MTDDQEDAKAPRTLGEIDALQRPARFGRYQFSLARLMVQANILGLVVAVIVKTRGGAIGTAITLGLLFAFLAPALALCYIGCSEIYAWRRKRSAGSRPAMPAKQVVSRKSAEADVSFDELE